MEHVAAKLDHLRDLHIGLTAVIEAALPVSFNEGGPEHGLKNSRPPVRLRQGPRPS